MKEEEEGRYWHPTPGERWRTRKDSRYCHPTIGKRREGNFLMSRPNQRHPTFPILLNPDNIPRRALLSLIDHQLLPRRSSILHQLEVVSGTAFSNPDSHIALLLCFALETESATFVFEIADFGVDVAIGAVVAFLNDEGSAVVIVVVMMVGGGSTFFHDSLLVVFRGSGRWWRGWGADFFKRGLAFDVCSW